MIATACVVSNVRLLQDSISEWWVRRAERTPLTAEFPRAFFQKREVRRVGSFGESLIAIDAAPRSVENVAQDR